VELDAVDDAPRARKTADGLALRRRAFNPALVRSFTIETLIEFTTSRATEKEIPKRIAPHSRAKGNDERNAAN